MENRNVLEGGQILTFDWANRVIAYHDTEINTGVKVNWNKGGKDQRAATAFDFDKAYGRFV